MALKRSLVLEENEKASEAPTAGNKRRQLIATIFKERDIAPVMQEFTPYLEPMIRKMVQEAVDHGINRFLRPSLDQTESSGPRTLQLQIHSSLPTTLFTNSNIESEDKSPIKLVLYDSITNTIVQSGPLSSVKVTIVVLDGDFGSDDREDWSKEEFDKKIVHSREGKRPLVTGALIMSLKDGVGCVGEVSFTDNSCWIRGRKFRLGVKAHIDSDQIRIREGTTSAFKVKDHRGEAYKKNYPPLLDDEVWRLEKIAKDGASHKKLSKSEILSVKDFLRMYIMDKNLLRNVLGVSNNKWETIIRHATTCPLDGKKYLYRTAHGSGLFFDSIRRVIGVTFDGHNLCPLDYLSTHQMSLVENLKQHAYKDSQNWISIDDSSSFGNSMRLMCSGADDLNPSLDLQDGKLIVEQDQFEFQKNQEDPTTSHIYNCEVEQNHSTFRNLSEESSHQRYALYPASRNHSSMNDSQDGFYATDFGGNCMASQLSTDDLPIDDSFMVDSSAWHGSWSFLGRNNHEIVSSDSVHVPMNEKCKTSWCKILAVVKWGILVKRNVAARKWKHCDNYIQV